jgi:redox-sensitive bicupin YhaK (pirin superfamily)
MDVGQWIDLAKYKMKTRSINKHWQALPTMEGAGVHLHRAFGYYEIPHFDPFLLMDDFRNDQPDKYLKGFPWHPHRGIETITYMLEGEVEHGDSLGNKGVITSGDVQWMTAGSGIVHQEMPKKGVDGKMYGFQLWANLPASHKMMTPRYQEIQSKDIPVVSLENGVKIKIICGQVNGVQGPAKDIVIDPEYLDITIPPGVQYDHPTKSGYTAFAYIIGGKGETGDETKSAEVENQWLVLYQDGDQVHFKAGPGGMRILFVSGKPLGEPIAWGGPIVMNTQDELDLAFEEFRSGKFIK